MFYLGVLYSIFLLCIPYFIFLKIRELKIFVVTKNYDGKNELNEVAPISSKSDHISNMEKMGGKSYGRQTELEVLTIGKKFTLEGTTNQELSTKGL